MFYLVVWYFPDFHGVTNCCIGMCSHVKSIGKETVIIIRGTVCLWNITNRLREYNLHWVKSSINEAARKWTSLASSFTRSSLTLNICDIMKCFKKLKFYSTIYSRNLSVVAFSRSESLKKHHFRSDHSGHPPTIAFHHRELDFPLHKLMKSLRLVRAR